MEGSLTAEAELRPSGGIKEYGSVTPSGAEASLEGGFAAGFPPSALPFVVLWNSEALEALLLAASGEQEHCLS